MHLSVEMNDPVGRERKKSLEGAPALRRWVGVGGRVSFFRDQKGGRWVDLGRWENS